MLDLNLRVHSDLHLPSDIVTHKHFIDGQYLESASGEVTERVAPSHGVVVSRAAKGTEAEVNLAVAAARRAFDNGRWCRIAAKERAIVLTKVADLIEQNVERFALIESLESGKPISQARGEVGGAAELWRFAASLARTSTGETHNNLGDDILAMTVKEPIGVVSIITPWNFPFWILSQKLPFALAAGCTCVIKPSEFTPSTTAMLADLLVQAGMPKGVCNIVLGHGDPVGALMTSHSDVDMISFTGSTAVGKKVAEVASDTLKKVTSELGGKNPQVIMPDADLDAAADAVVFGVYFNVGQCCNSSSRIIVHQDIANAFIEKVVALSKKVVFGNPLHADTQVGAIVTPEHQQKIDTYIKDAINQGATVHLGGAGMHVEGLSKQFYQPTVISNVRPDMAISREEVFGPVLTVLTFQTLDEAIQITNDTEYGLSAGIWSENINNCLEFSRRANAGTIWTNTWMDGFPEVTFGGMKQSGQGREIGQYGFDEFLEIKSMVMRIGKTRAPWVGDT